MKQLVIFMMLLLPCTIVAQVDDMYYVPTKKITAKSTSVNDDISDFTTTQTRLGSSTTVRDVDEYNRRYSSAYVSDDDNYSSDEYSDEAVEEDYDYTYVDEEADDYTYSTRIVRFHSPRRVIVSSPWYWDVVYCDGFDSWTVYDNGCFYDIYPTYTYSSWYYPSWSLTLSWGSWWHRPWGWAPHHHHYGWHHAPAFGGWHSWGAVRRPTFGNLRTGNLAVSRSAGSVGRSRAANLSARGDGATGVRRSGNVSARGDGSSLRRNGTEAAERDGRTTVQRINRGKDASGQATNVRRGSENSDNRTYNRPSSTRTTSRSTATSSSEEKSSRSGSSVSRSSGSSSRSGSVSRSSGSSSRSGGSVSRSSGSSSRSGGSFSRSSGSSSRSGSVSRSSGSRGSRR